MASSQGFYVPLHHKPELALSEASAIDEGDELHHGLSWTRKRRHSEMFFSMLTGTLLVIIILQAIFMMRLRANLQSKTLSPNGLGLTRDFERRGSIPTKYMSENETEAAKAWDDIEAGHGLVVVDPQWSAAQGLPPTFRHPIDSTKVVYVIEAYHQIHCLVSQTINAPPTTNQSKFPDLKNPISRAQKVIREHYMALAAGKEPRWSAEHDMHCFDTLRQHIMCMADDTLLYSTGHRDTGVNQTRMCRDWDALSRWATERTACYHDYVAPRGETRWGKCDGGRDGLPVGSLLE